MRENTSWELFWNVWASVTGYSVAICSIIYLVFGILSTRQRIPEDARWASLPLLYAAWGAIFSFLGVSVIAAAIGTAYVALHETMTIIELSVYVSSFVITFLYFGSGDIPVLYAM